MRKILIVAILLCACFTANCQTNMNVPEPEFVGEVVVVRADSTVWCQTLPKERASKRTVASASMYLIGLGDVKTKLSIKEHHSPLQISDEFEYKFIVKAISNQFDPISIIRFFKLEREGEYENKRRAAVLVKNSSLGALETNTREYVNFTAKKYGESSYILTAELAEGEYGITVNSTDEVNSVVATFGVYSHIKQAQIEREKQIREAAIAEREALKAERKAKREAKANKGDSD